MKTETVLETGEHKSEYELARWAALVYGVNVIADMAEDMKQDFDKVCIDHPALSKYVDEISDDILHAIQSYSNPL